MSILIGSIIGALVGVAISLMVQIQREKVYRKTLELLNALLDEIKKQEETIRELTKDKN